MWQDVVTVSAGSSVRAWTYFEEVTGKPSITVTPWTTRTAEQRSNGATDQVVARSESGPAVSCMNEKSNKGAHNELRTYDHGCTFEAKLGSDAGQELGDYLILGVCNPALAQKALAADPDMGLLLPCNVVIRRGPGAGTTIIQAIDPQTMVQLSDAPAITEVATDADHKLLTALKELETA